MKIAITLIILFSSLWAQPLKLDALPNEFVPQIRESVGKISHKMTILILYMHVVSQKYIILAFTKPLIRLALIFNQ